MTLTWVEAGFFHQAGPARLLRDTTHSAASVGLPPRAAAAPRGPAFIRERKAKLGERASTVSSPYGETSHRQICPTWRSSISDKGSINIRPALPAQVQGRILQEVRQGLELKQEANKVAASAWKRVKATRREKNSRKVIARITVLYMKIRMSRMKLKALRINSKLRDFSGNFEV